MNQLKGKITSIQSSQHLSLVDVEIDGDTLRLLLLENPIETIGSEVDLVFKESEVILSKEAICSTANICSGRISKIEEGSILTYVTLLYHDKQIAALVPSATFASLGCKPNDTVYWIISPSEISLQRGHHGS
ncbi:MAG: TOBE domain-containing protein [Campylobacterales bacterium]|nr:TOBE domain-containing protein [Campylobacterales bacterium]